MQTLASYYRLLESLVTSNLNYLTKTEPQFVSESVTFQIRKKIFEIIQRSNPFQNIVNFSESSNPTGYESKVKLCRDLLTLVYNMIERENEENVIICFKIIIDYHRYLKNSNLNKEVISLLRILQ
jgi:transformation/transcription domain-associated protein